MNLARLRYVVVLLTSWTAAGCANYDFDTVRRADGTYEVSRLMADLDRIGGLGQVGWFPLVHVEARTFDTQDDKNQPMADLSEGRYPPGYRLTEIDGWGPLFSYIHVRSTFYDQSGDGYEVQMVRSLLFRIWEQTRSVVETTKGSREMSRHDLLFGLITLRPSVIYSPPPPSTE